MNHKQIIENHMSRLNIPNKQKAEEFLEVRKHWAALHFCKTPKTYKTKTGLRYVKKVKKEHECIYCYSKIPLSHSSYIRLISIGMCNIDYKDTDDNYTPPYTKWVSIYMCSFDCVLGFSKLLNNSKSLVDVFKTRNELITFNMEKDEIVLSVSGIFGEAILKAKNIDFPYYTKGDFDE